MVNGLLLMLLVPCSFCATGLINFIHKCVPGANCIP